jgi:hypothetical protein
VDAYDSGETYSTKPEIKGGTCSFSREAFAPLIGREAPPYLN